MVQSLQGPHILSLVVLDVSEVCARPGCRSSDDQEICAVNCPHLSAEEALRIYRPWRSILVDGLCPGDILMGSNMAVGRVERVSGRLQQLGCDDRLGVVRSVIRNNRLTRRHVAAKALARKCVRYEVVPENVLLRLCTVHGVGVAHCTERV